MAASAFHLKYYMFVKAVIQACVFLPKVGYAVPYIWGPKILKVSSDSLCGTGFWVTLPLTGTAVHLHTHLFEAVLFRGLRLGADRLFGQDCVVETLTMQERLSLAPSGQGLYWSPCPGSAEWS